MQISLVVRLLAFRLPKFILLFYFFSRRKRRKGKGWGGYGRSPMTKKKTDRKDILSSNVKHEGMRMKRLHIKAILVDKFLTIRDQDIKKSCHIRTTTQQMKYAHRLGKSLELGN